jgi:hypothetical protein
MPRQWCRRSGCGFGSGWGRDGFELRGVRFAGATVSFFIKPADGLALPDIMKWIKQTCGYIWMMGGRGISGAPKVARETLSVLLYPGSTAGP